MLTNSIPESSWGCKSEHLEDFFTPEIHYKKSRSRATKIIEKIRKWFAKDNRRVQIELIGGNFSLRNRQVCETDSDSRATEAYPGATGVCDLWLNQGFLHNRTFLMSIGAQTTIPAGNYVEDIVSASNEITPSEESKLMESAPTFPNHSEISFLGNSPAGISRAQTLVPRELNSSSLLSTETRFRRPIAQQTPLPISIIRQTRQPNTGALINVHAQLLSLRDDLAYLSVDMYFLVRRKPVKVVPRTNPALLITYPETKNDDSPCVVAFSENDHVVKNVELFPPPQNPPLGKDESSLSDPPFFIKPSKTETVPRLENDDSPCVVAFSENDHVVKTVELSSPPQNPPLGKGESSLSDPPFFIKPSKTETVPRLENGDSPRVIALSENDRISVWGESFSRPQNFPQGEDKDSLSEKEDSAYQKSGLLHSGSKRVQQSMASSRTFSSLSNFQTECHLEMTSESDGLMTRVCLQQPFLPRRPKDLPPEKSIHAFSSLPHSISPERQMQPCPSRRSAGENSSMRTNDRKAGKENFKREQGKNGPPQIGREGDFSLLDYRKYQQDSDFIIHHLQTINERELSERDTEKTQMKQHSSPEKLIHHEKTVPTSIPPPSTTKLGKSSTITPRNTHRNSDETLQQQCVSSVSSFRGNQERRVGFGAMFQAPPEGLTQEFISQAQSIWSAILFIIIPYEGMKNIIAIFTSRFFGQLAAPRIQSEKSHGTVNISHVKSLENGGAAVWDPKTSIVTVSRDKKQLHVLPREPEKYFQGLS